MGIALLVKLDSAGGIFYSHERLGKNGRKIRIYKFRTMAVNAEAVLDEYLRTHPEAREEWDQNQKLRDDPRVTRVGRWLRKYSLDEFPQLFNVLKGDMSLVGPRPMMADQVRLYGDNMEAYCGVRPGMTGMWQVSGRNRATFAERARFDIYYIRNWTLWLDFYILLRTVWVVFSRDGAY
jgi:Undecaprenyl-phosphate galactose phosphotransferase WbaP